MIKPTVGRIVWFYPLSDDSDFYMFPSVRAGEPLAAIVAHVWGDSCVNLAVFDPNGKSHTRTSIMLFQHDSVLRPSCGYCGWMPYQVGQARAAAAAAAAPEAAK